MKLALAPDHAMIATLPGSPAPPGWTGVPARCCRGCGPATSPSSTTSTSTGPPPRRSSTRERRRGRQRVAVHLRPLPEPRAQPCWLEAGVVLVDDVGQRRTRRGPRRAARSGSTTAVVLDGDQRDGQRPACSTCDTLRGRLDDARGGLATQLRELHPQHHRVPPARAGPAPARHGRSPDSRTESRAGPRSSWSRGPDLTTSDLRRPQARTSASSTRC